MAEIKISDMATIAGLTDVSLFEVAHEGLTYKATALQIKTYLDLFDGDYSSLTGVPVEFDPTAHTHPQSDITDLDTALAAKAPLASAPLTGNPTAPTQLVGNNSTRLATTEFVAVAVAALIDGAPGAIDTLNELAAALSDDPDFAATTTNTIAGKLAIANNLSDLANIATARTNLGVAIGTDVAAFSHVGSGGAAHANVVAAGAAGFMTGADKTKLNGIATAATANQSDATLLARANHTGTQAAATISDLSEAVDDRVAALLVAGTNITITYNDGTNTLSIAAAGGASGQHLTLADYGVDFTGATDNSVEVQTAIDAAVAADKPLYVPPGTVACTGITLKSGLHMFGAPAYTSRFIFPALTTVGGIFGTGTTGVRCEDLTLEDLVFDGQQQQRTVDCGGALLKAYKAARWTLKRVWVKNSTSYGFGFQGYPGVPQAARQDVVLDLLMEDCRFTDCGYIGGTVGTPRSGTPNSADNIDIKSVERAVLNKVYSAYSSDPCLDIRARRADIVGCSFEGSGGVGIEAASHRPTLVWATATAYAVEDSVTQGGNVYRCVIAHTSGTFATDLAAARWVLQGDIQEWLDNDSYITILGGRSVDNVGGGIAISENTGQSDTHCDLIGFQSGRNGGSGVFMTAPATGGNVRLSIIGGKYHNNTVHGMHVRNVQYLSIRGVLSFGNGDDGLSCQDQNGGVINGVFRANASFGIQSTGTSDNLFIDADVRDNAGTVGLVGTKNRVRAHYATSTQVTVASAATVALPTQEDFIQVTGTTTITSITAAYPGRLVTLVFAASCIVTNGASLLLAGGVNFSATANDTLSLRCLAAGGWVEVGRSVN